MNFTILEASFQLPNELRLILMNFHYSRIMLELGNSIYQMFIAPEFKLNEEGSINLIDTTIFNYINFICSILLYSV